MPAYTIQGRKGKLLQIKICIEESPSKETPGPQTYTLPMPAIKRKNPIWTYKLCGIQNIYRFGSGQRISMRSTFHETPGPGAYSQSLSHKKTSPAYKMGLKNYKERAQPIQIPGPGVYHPNPRAVEQNTSFG